MPAAKKPAKAVKTKAPAAKATKKPAPKAVKAVAKAPSARPLAVKPSAPVKPAAAAKPAAAKVSAVKVEEYVEPTPTPSRPRVTVPLTGGQMLAAHPDAELNKVQLKALYDKLMVERERVMTGLGRHINEATLDNDSLADEVDVAQRHTDQAYLIRFADKERKLLLEIEHAIEKILTGEYGVCEGTGEPIAYKRLELRPWTRYSVEYKEQLEREKAQHA